MVSIFTCCHLRPVMTIRPALLLFFCLTASAFESRVPDVLPPINQYHSAVGNCLAELREILPVAQSLDYFVGTGWDNLRNVHTRPVLLHTFNQCQTTPEGNYLIPDNVIAIPIEKTEFDQMATFHDSFTSYSESITDTINVEASGSIAFGFLGSISGTYSEKHQKTRLEMATISSNLFITKKSHSYSLLVNPDAGLHPVFKKSLLMIADLLKQGLSERAMLEAQLVVRDYGTHYLSRAEAGTIIEQSTYVSRDFDYKSEVHLDEMKATASANFHALFASASASVNTGKTVTNQMTSALSSITRHVRINSEGSLPCRLLSFQSKNNETCTNGIDHLVSLDHQGEPLSFLVSSQLLPELRHTEVYQLASLLDNVTLEYYKRNVIPGCMDVNDVNFNFQANVNDETCKGVEPAVAGIGGVYQTCERVCMAIFSFELCPPQYRCDQFIQKNTITGDFSCPVGYHSEPIVDFVYAGFEDRVETSSYEDCNFFGFACTTHVQHHVYKDKVRLRSYACIQTIRNLNTGYLFGGLYAKGQPNVWTNKESCPPYFFDLKIAGDVRICLSRDMERGGPYKIPLNWIFSCQTEETKQKCVDKYSAHLLTITPTQCEVYYCTRPGVNKRFDLPHIKRPPYLSPSVRLTNVSTHYVRYYVNDTMVLNSPLEIVLNQTVKDELKNNTTENLASGSPDINVVINKWIRKQLLKRERFETSRRMKTTTTNAEEVKQNETSERNESISSHGWVFWLVIGATTLLATIVAVIVVIYCQKRRV